MTSSAFARKTAPQHSFDRNYEATRPQRGESLYEWATTDYFNMNQPTWINAFTMLPHELKVTPKIDKFMAHAKAADVECLKCSEINKTRNPGDPKIPCLVSKMDDRCALCIVTKERNSACRSQLPANYPWPGPRRSRAPLFSHIQLSPISPRNPSPAWTLDTTGDATLRKEVPELPQERQARRSASPVRQSRYYDQEAPKEPGRVVAQRKRRQSVSAFDVAESSAPKRYQRAATVGPGSHGHDEGLRDEDRENPHRTSNHVATNSASQSPPRMESNAKVVYAPTTSEIESSSTSTSLVPNDTIHQSPTSVRTSTTMSEPKTPLSSSDSTEDVPLASIQDTFHKPIGRSARHALLFAELSNDFKLNEEKIKDLEKALEKEKANTKALQAEKHELHLRLESEQEKAKQVQQNDEEIALLKAEKQRLQTTVDRIAACLRK